MIESCKLTLQLIAISSFGFLTIIGYLQKDWNLGFGLNLALTLLYIFLYLQPIK
jgi:hypothetical protein